MTHYAVWFLSTVGGENAFYGLHPSEEAAEDFITRHMRLSERPRTRYEIEVLPAS